MAKIGNVPEIKEVKNHLQQMKNQGFLKDWELPYENLLTRLSAAIFFISPCSEDKLDEIWENMKIFVGFRYKKNEDKKMSQLEYRIEFNSENE